jgi:uncharacterized LabA/DUF88 family protein
MKTMSVTLTNTEYDQFGFSGIKIDFAEFVNKVNRRVTRKNLDDCVALAEEYGLSSMTMDDISAEVAAVRNAKNNL